MSGRLDVLVPQFVDVMPGELEFGVLYVSVEFKSIQHLCCCGCGGKVVTPLSPSGWCMEFDGRSVSLRPSIGSWQKACRSHYFIIENRVRWVPRWWDELPPDRRGAYPLMRRDDVEGLFEDPPRGHAKTGRRARRRGPAGAKRLRARVTRTKSG